jgi:GLPGLI family protein
MKAMLPQFRSANFQLLFTDNQSLYKAMPEENAPDPFASPSGGTAVIRMMADETEQYKNFTASKSVEGRPLGAKNYIIEDTLKTQGWKLSDETKTILNHTCKKATFENTERKQTIEAWYAEDIVTPAGPDNFGGLPGLILQVDINKGETVYTATNISEKVDVASIQEPKKGKKVTRKEFAKLMEDTYGTPGSGGQRIVIRNM